MFCVADTSGLHPTPDGRHRAATTGAEWGWTGRASAPNNRQGRLEAAGSLKSTRSTPCPAGKTSEVVRTIGIDTGKEHAAHDWPGWEAARSFYAKRSPGAELLPRLVNVPPCLIGIEAGMATHYVSRELLTLGHSVKQVPPAYSRSRFGKATKTISETLLPGRRSRATSLRRACTVFPIKTDDQLGRVLN